MCASPAWLRFSPESEPKDFDEFWARQFARLDKVPIREERIEIDCANPKARLGMVLRVKRGLQYLKTVKGWNGTELKHSKSCLDNTPVRRLLML